MSIVKTGTPVWNNQYHHGKVLAAYDSPKYGYLADIIIDKAGEEFILHAQNLDEWEVRG